jgi:3-oxoacyl-(acyl-carrier-protein) synthase
VSHAVVIRGGGVVSPAGWGLNPFRAALGSGAPLPAGHLPRPGWELPLVARRTPPPPARPAFLSHPRLRRSSPITHYAVAAALEALGEHAKNVAGGELRLGVISCVMSGCVNYSRRFYDEALRDPATASPLVFPETVFNAPASHLAALLGTTSINYTLVGDPGTFLVALALAADWLLESRVDGCLVIGAEELDWLTADAFRLFNRKVAVSDGAGALYLERAGNGEPGVQLAAVTSAFQYTTTSNRAKAAQAMVMELASAGPCELLYDGTQGLPVPDAAESRALAGWHGARQSPKRVLGEGLMAAAAWQCVAAVDALQNRRAASTCVSIVGCNQQAIGARFAAFPL